jgi:anti-anti-sigma factor
MSQSVRRALFGLTIGVEHRDTAVIVHVRGELDVATAPELREAIATALRDAPSLLVINLSGVRFLASSGMAALADAHQVGAGRTTIRVVATGRECLRPIRLTGLDATMEIHPTVHDAVL